jgi:hypothetical protein
MKNTKIKTKISTISVILLLTISAILVALPAVNAQTYNLIMNTSTTGIYGSPHAVDLNGPSEQLTGLKFAYIPPGGTEWIITTEPPIDNEPGLPGERYVTDSGGDCDIEWTATDGKGDYQVKWVHPASGSESDVVTVTMGDPPTLVTYPFIGAVPNPVGAGQTVLLHVGIFQQLTRQPMGWDMEVMIEDPTGHTTTITDIMTDSTGGTGVTFTPTMVGIYKLRSHFPEQILTPEKTAPGAGVGSVMKESFSAVLELEVQTDPIPYYPGHSLPNEYWTRPIDPQLREWTRIAGSSWLHSIGDSDQYVVTGNEDAPDSAHILWTKEVTQGGIAGGVREANSEWAFSHGDAYEGKWNHRMIINGILIYTHRTNIRPLVYTAVNVRTGEVMWEKTFLDNQSISFGQNLVWGGYNHHAVYSYLWVTPRNSPWYAFDPYTGD